MAMLLVAGGLLFHPTTVPVTPVAQMQVQPGTAVGDLQELDKNHELLANFDMLDDLSPDEPQTQDATP